MQFDVTRPENIYEGSIDGIEFALQHFFVGTIHNHSVHITNSFFSYYIFNDYSKFIWCNYGSYCHYRFIE